MFILGGASTYWPAGALIFEVEDRVFGMEVGLTPKGAGRTVGLSR